MIDRRLSPRNAAQYCMSFVPLKSVLRVMLNYWSGRLLVVLVPIGPFGLPMTYLFKIEQTPICTNPSSPVVLLAS
jgi:hypothetical protein